MYMLKGSPFSYRSLRDQEAYIMRKRGHHHGLFHKYVICVGGELVMNISCRWSWASPQEPLTTETYQGVIAFFCDARGNDYSNLKRTSGFLNSQVVRAWMYSDLLPQFDHCSFHTTGAIAYIDSYPEYKSIIIELNWSEVTTITIISAPRTGNPWQQQHINFFKSVFL